MSSTWSSKDGFAPSNSVATAIDDLSHFIGWKNMQIVDVPTDESREAFDWLIEQHGHNEYNSSYGPTRDSQWFGPFTSYINPSHCYILRNQQDAALLKLFYG